jgi:hypothetical protein
MCIRQARDVVKALKKRLVHKNWKVQLLALTVSSHRYFFRLSTSVRCFSSLKFSLGNLQVLEAMMKNCGEIVQQSVAEKDVLPEMVKIVKKKVKVN